jgi:hypothetical protein
MATNYTVIAHVRQRFGDNSRDWGELPVEQEAPFVGLSKDFPFGCPSIDRSQPGVLQFNSLGVSDYRNVIEINGVAIPGGISVGPVWIYVNPNPPLWNTHSLLVAGNVLQENNVLHIAATPDQFGKYDDFIIDNVVIWFKTRSVLPPAAEAS